MDECSFEDFLWMVSFNSLHQVMMFPLTYIKFAARRTEEWPLQARRQLAPVRKFGERVLLSTGPLINAGATEYTRSTVFNRGVKSCRWLIHKASQILTASLTSSLSSKIRFTPNRIIGHLRWYRHHTVCSVECARRTNRSPVFIELIKESIRRWRRGCWWTLYWRCRKRRRVWWRCIAIKSWRRSLWNWGIQVERAQELLYVLYKWS